jgi:hypothetical protein
MIEELETRIFFEERPVQLGPRKMKTEHLRWDEVHII